VYVSSFFSFLFLTILSEGPAHVSDDSNVRTFIGERNTKAARGLL
jgi:hypothetical protein